MTRARHRGEPRSEPLTRSPTSLSSWMALLCIVVGVGFAVVLIGSLPSVRAQGSALEHGPCADDVRSPCASVETGRLDEPYDGGRRFRARYWPVVLDQRRVVVGLSGSARPAGVAGDPADVWTYDEEPIALVVDGIRYDARGTGWSGVALHAGGGIFFLAVASVGFAEMLARAGRLRRFGRSLRIASAVVGALAAVALLAGLIGG